MDWGCRWFVMWFVIPMLSMGLKGLSEVVQVGVEYLFHTGYLYHLVFITMIVRVEPQTLQYIS